MQPGKEGTLISKEYLRLHLDGTLPVTQYVGRCRNTLPTAVGLEGIAALPKAAQQTAKQTLFGRRLSWPSRCLYINVRENKIYNGVE